MKKTRCAIYTRKSSEEGLDQEFNSLHAQREACAAYILSQKHEGWELLPQEYDDGGFSGGTMERPALKQLLQDISEGQVDVIVVYKVDRLTRSLADFAKLVEVMDKKGVSFVSITQQFNTTSSMGRLTLNVLLSFAQFEREVTGERIRDKIALSKQKGKWMGGIAPVGYKSEKRKLVICEEEARVIRHIYTRYLQVKSVHLLMAELEAEGYRTKIADYAGGKRGGVPYIKSHLYRILENRIYIGEIVHKGKNYSGEHEPIIDRELFDRVQKTLAEGRVRYAGMQSMKDPCLLAGRIYDDRGYVMTAKHSHSRKRKYRYYTSQAILQGYALKAGSLPNIPAYEIEQLVKVEIQGLLSDRERLQPYISHETLARQNALLRKAEAWSAQNLDQERLFLRSVLSRVEVGKARVAITLCAARLVEALGGQLPGSKPDSVEHPILIERKIGLAAANNGSKVIIGSKAPCHNLQLLKAVTRSFLWNEQLLSGEVFSVRDIAQRESISSPTYVSRVMRLRFLAPDIIEAILKGTQPAEWTVEKLFRLKELDWPTQRRVLGFQNS